MWVSERKLNILYSSRESKRRKKIKGIIPPNISKPLEKPPTFEINDSTIVSAEFCHPEATYYSEEKVSDKKSDFVIGIAGDYYYIHKKYLQEIRILTEKDYADFNRDNTQGTFIEERDGFIYFTTESKLGLDEIGKINGYSPFKFILDSDAEDVYILLSTKRNLKNDGIHMALTINSVNPDYTNIKEISQTTYDSLDLEKIKSICNTFESISNFHELSGATHAYIDDDSLIILSTNKILLVCSKEKGKGTGKILIESAIKFAKTKNYDELTLDAMPKAFPFFIRLGFIPKLWAHNIKL
tara:strand:+ start:1762 stop:2655 length:894 start_codon:yes stop_codon:yes gene_type:complete